MGGNWDSLEVFRLFSMFQKGKAFKYPQKENLFWQFQAMFHMFGTYAMYLDIGRDNDEDYE